MANVLQKEPVAILLNEAIFGQNFLTEPSIHGLLYLCTSINLQKILNSYLSAPCLLLARIMECFKLYESQGIFSEMFFNSLYILHGSGNVANDLVKLDCLVLPTPKYTVITTVTASSVSFASLFS